MESAKGDRRGEVEFMEEVKSDSGIPPIRGGFTEQASSGLRHSEERKPTTSTINKRYDT